ncbi:MAG: ArsC/Spx/MgsR family protein [Burkholderiales bacterium]
MELYGIKNCATVRNARAWLAQHGYEVAFHDFNASRPSEAVLRQWVEHAGWERRVNRQGMTWRKLPDAAKNLVRDEDAAIVLRMDKPGVIKRPVLEKDGKRTVGFAPDVYSLLFRRP